MDGCRNLFKVMLPAILLSLITIIPYYTFAQSLDYKPKILLVTAHPDDDALFSATVFKTTHLLDGIVDLAIMTNGEGGYQYSTLGNYIYGLELDKEETGRAYLPGIRKHEVMEGGKIVGIRNYHFFDQVDDQFSYDIEIPLKRWNTEWIVQRLSKLMGEEKYDFLFTMMPSDSTHAHHKASAILALKAVERLEPDKRPIALATTFSVDKSELSSYQMLEGYPISEIDRSAGHFIFDRTQKFGRNDRLDYNIITNWVIAEHKSQGTMQKVMNLSEAEEYWYYKINPEQGVKKVREYFRAVVESEVYEPKNESAPKR